METIREWVNSYESEVPTPLWTRGRDFPIGILASRLKMPATDGSETMALARPCRNFAKPLAFVTQ